MGFEKPAIDLIKTRRSIRSYEIEPLKQEAINSIIALIEKDNNTVFGSKLRFEFIDASGLDPGSLKELGTYGMINGARYFIAGIIKGNGSDGHGLVDFGHAFEKIILSMTDLGLGTCWLGGTFNRKGFSDKITLKEDEAIQAVTPVGIISRKRHLKSSIIRAMVGAKNRKGWDKLFFNNSFSVPLSEPDAGAYQVPLEMVRIGPSASNLQPWRIMMEDKNVFHFFIERTKRPAYSKFQNMDLGIALCHFELSAAELALKGRWEVKEGIQQNTKYGIPPDMEYVISWDGS